MLLLKQKPAFMAGFLFSKPKHPSSQRRLGSRMLWRAINRAPSTILGPSLRWDDGVLGYFVVLAAAAVVAATAVWSIFNT
ncbi:hypothetical protein [Pseudomonas turukhanskensis]|uniref:hypothetical protein n=1 Tax=Pseudomonas turukhanskensis TaxID=1806536 RepID=UPI0022F2AF3C|nr:hypothetical protein [Pseudomonas turukhanskensis]